MSQITREHHPIHIPLNHYKIPLNHYKSHQKTLHNYQLVLTSQCHLAPCLTPSGPVVVSLIGLGTRSGQEVAGGQIAILGGGNPNKMGLSSGFIKHGWLENPL